MDEPEQTASPARAPVPADGESPPVDEDRDETANDRTLPFPYAESFDEWVADETEDPDGRKHPRDVGDLKD